MSNCQYHPPSKGKARALYRVRGKIADLNPVNRNVCRECLIEAIKMLLPKVPGRRMTVTRLPEEQDG